MKVSTFVLKLVGNSVFVLSFAIAGPPVKAATLDFSGIQRIGITDNGTVNGTLNTSNSAMGQGFGGSFKSPYYILGARDNHIANDSNDTGESGGQFNQIRIPLTFTAEDLKKPQQQFDFNVAFNGTITNKFPKDFFQVLLLDLSNGLNNEDVLNAQSTLIREATLLSENVASSELKPNIQYFLTFSLNEEDRNLISAVPLLYGSRKDTENTAVGFNFVSVKAVPEPSSVLGVLAFGAFGAGTLLKRQLKKQKSATLDKSSV